MRLVRMLELKLGCPRHSFGRQVNLATLVNSSYSADEQGQTRPAWENVQGCDSDPFHRAVSGARQCLRRNAASVGMRLVLLLGRCSLNTDRLT